MRALLIMIMVLNLTHGLHGQVYTNFVFGQYLYHSENDEPTTWTQPIGRFYSGDMGYENNLKGHRIVQLGVGYEENFNQLIAKHTTDPDYGSPVRTNLEQSPSIYARIAWSSRGMTGYGFGPVYSPSKHTFSVDLSGLKSHKEVIYSHAFGISGFVRFSKPVSKHLYGLLTLEGRYMKGLWFKSGGQDLSDFNHENIQIRIAVGLGRKP